MGAQRTHLTQLVDEWARRESEKVQSEEIYKSYTNREGKDIHINENRMTEAFEV